MLRLRQPAIDSPRLKWAWGFGIAGFVLTLTIFGVILAAPLFVIAAVLGLQERLIQRKQRLSGISADSDRNQAQLKDVQQQQRLGDGVGITTSTVEAESDVVDAEWAPTEEANMIALP